MTIEPIDGGDAAVIEQLLDVRLAAHAADEPDNAAPCRVRFRARMAHPSEEEELRHYAVRADGRIVGYLEMQLPLKENRHFAAGEVLVHPDYRRRGIGQALVEHALSVTRAAGRKTYNMVVRDTWQDGPKRPEHGKRLLEKLGFTLALTEVNRRADITAITPDTERRLLDEALAKSTGYETVAWHGRMPEELLGPIGRINSMIIDEVPLGDLELEAETFDAERVRTWNERSIRYGLHVIGVVARPVGSTEVVANTLVGVPTEPGDIANQWITIVDPKHRGHRLGMRVKIENLRQLRQVKPGVRYILTDNADINAPMVAINDAMGFTPVDANLEYQIDV